MSAETAAAAERNARLIWRLRLWPAQDRLIWEQAIAGPWPEGLDNPATSWRPRTVRKTEDGYGQYLSWLFREGLLVEDAPVTERITPERLNEYTAHLKSYLAPMSIAAMVDGLGAAARALAPCADWSFLLRRTSRLRLRAKPSRDKRHAVRHTFDLYGNGKELMDTASRGKQIPCVAYRYQAGLLIALLAARPVRVRNFQSIAIGKSLRWDGSRYWLSFGTDETKMRCPINEPLPDDLLPYLEAFLLTWRQVLLRQARRFSGDAPGGHLWINRSGPMKECTLRALIKRYTQRKFGTEIWPHLFRDCLLTSVALDQPELLRVSTAPRTFEFPQREALQPSRMLEASRRYGDTISELRQRLLDADAATRPAPKP